jgi:hypothetical protein
MRTYQVRLSRKLFQIITRVVSEKKEKIGNLMKLGNSDLAGSIDSPSQIRNFELQFTNTSVCNVPTIFCTLKNGQIYCGLDDIVAFPILLELSFKVELSYIFIFLLF